MSNPTKFDTDEVSRIYHDQYQKDSVSGRALQAYSEIADVLIAAARPKSAIDIGSGGGALVRALVDKGVDAYGVEGSLPAVELYPERLKLWDLRAPYAPDQQYDMVTSFDVGEHIEQEFHGIFCNSIDRCLKPGGILFFGAAAEGQDGLGHIACKHPCWWIAKLAPLQLFAAGAEEVRAAIKAKPNTNFLWWVDKNLMMFSKPV